MSQQIESGFPRRASRRVANRLGHVRMEVTVPADLVTEVERRSVTDQRSISVTVARLLRAGLEGGDCPVT